MDSSNASFGSNDSLAESFLAEINSRQNLIRYQVPIPYGDEFDLQPSGGMNYNANQVYQRYNIAGGNSGNISIQLNANRRNNPGNNPNSSQRSSNNNANRRNNSGNNSNSSQRNANRRNNPGNNPNSSQRSSNSNANRRNNFGNNSNSGQRNANNYSNHNGNSNHNSGGTRNCPVAGTNRIVSQIYDRPNNRHLSINRQQNQQRYNPNQLIERVRLDDTQSIEMRELRKSILSIYKCPFREEGSCRNENTPDLCMFSHPETIPSDQSKTSTNDQTKVALRSLPSWLCIYHILGACKRGSKKVSCDDNEVERCKNGVHVNIEQLVDLESLESQHAQLIKNFFGDDGERECSICFDRVLAKCIPRNRRFGLLENCTHEFCAGCLRIWRQRNQGCPVCRVKSNRYIIQNRWVENADEKRELFSNVRPDHRLAFAGNYDDFDAFTSGLAYAMQQFLVDDGYDESFIFDPLPLEDDLDPFEVELEWW